MNTYNRHIELKQHYALEIEPIKTFHSIRQNRNTCYNLTSSCLYWPLSVHFTFSSSRRLVCSQSQFKQKIASTFCIFCISLGNNFQLCCGCFGKYFFFSILFFVALVFHGSSHLCRIHLTRITGALQICCSVVYINYRLFQHLRCEQKTNKKGAVTRYPLRGDRGKCQLL